MKTLLTQVVPVLVAAAVLAVWIPGAIAEPDLDRMYFDGRHLREVGYGQIRFDGRGPERWAWQGTLKDRKIVRLEARVARLRRELRRRLAPVAHRYEHAADVMAIAYDVDAATLKRKGRCESVRWTQFTNRRSGAAGPWQFLWSTWRSTPFARFSRYDPEAAAGAAAFMHSVGRGSEWVCR